MDPELRQYLDANFASIDRKFEAVDRRFAAIDQRFAAIDQRFAAIDQRFEAVEAKIEKVETAPLTEFHKWASPAEMRARTHAAALRAIDLEMESLSDRVSKLEGKEEQ